MKVTTREEAVEERLGSVAAEQDADGHQLSRTTRLESRYSLTDATNGLPDLDRSRRHVDRQEVDERVDVAQVASQSLHRFALR